MYFYISFDPLILKEVVLLCVPVQKDNQIMVIWNTVGSDQLLINQAVCYCRDFSFVADDQYGTRQEWKVNLELLRTIFMIFYC